MKKIFYLISLILITSCGFNVVDQSKRSNFRVSDINTSGDKKINYILRNNLTSSVKQGAKAIIINIETDKIKSIKEKNIKNEITKYKIEVITNVEVLAINNSKKFNFNKNEIGEFSVSTQNSITRNNEKKLVSRLSKKLADEISNEIILNLNDL